MIGWCHEFTFYFGYTVFNKLKQRVKTMTLLDVQHVQKVYQTRFGAAEVTALKDINFSIEEGEYVAVMGENNAVKYFSDSRPSNRRKCSIKWRRHPKDFFKSTNRIQT